MAAEVQGDVQKLKEIASQTHAMIDTAAPDWQLSIDEVVAEGNSVVARLTEQGTFTTPYCAGPMRIEPTGNPAQLAAMEFFHVVDGKITERWTVRDRLMLFQQVGASIQIG